MSEEKKRFKNITFESKGNIMRWLGFMVKNGAGKSFGIGVLIATVLLCSCACRISGKNETSPKIKVEKEWESVNQNTEKNAISEKSAVEIVKDMSSLAGWNLGNTMDAFANGTSGLATETCWGQPKATQAMFKFLAKSGVKTVRIPTSWHNHFVDEKYTVDPAWMSRVQEIVDWAIGEGLYVILNIHHDNAENANVKYNGGYYPAEESKEESLKFLLSVWTQICINFNNAYDEHLIFETLNEPRLRNTDKEWWLDESDPKCTTALNIIMEYNQEILNVIRKSGGNNSKRLVMVPSYVASPDAALVKAFHLPKDISGNENRLALSVHMYSPYEFAMQDPGTKVFTDAHKKQLADTFSRLNEKFIKAGCPVIIGECGATNKNNPLDRKNWFGYFFTEARKLGIAAILWDNGQWEVNENGPYEEHFGYFDRKGLKWYFPELIDAANAN